MVWDDFLMENVNVGLYIYIIYIYTWIILGNVVVTGIFGGLSMKQANMFVL